MNISDIRKTDYWGLLLKYLKNRPDEVFSVRELVGVCKSLGFDFKYSTVYEFAYKHIPRLVQSQRYVWYGSSVAISRLRKTIKSAIAEGGKFKRI